MWFSKTGSIYKIIRITSLQDNILGISFVETNNNKNDFEIIEWDFPNIDKRKIRTSKEKVLEQVLSGLESVNKSFETNYKLSKIYFSPFEISTNRIYSGLIAASVKH